MIIYGYILTFCYAVQLDEEASESSKSARNTPIADKPFPRNLRDTPNRSETSSPAPSRSKHKQEKQVSKGFAYLKMLAQRLRTIDDVVEAYSNYFVSTPFF